MAFCLPRAAGLHERRVDHADDKRRWAQDQVLKEFARRSRPRRPGRTGARDAKGRRACEAAVAAFPAGLSRDVLARCFAWPLERVELAIAALEVRLHRQRAPATPDSAGHRYALGPNLSALTSQSS